LSSVFSPADNVRFLLSYAEWEKSRLGKWPVSLAEKKRGKAARRQQADTPSVNVTSPPPLLSSLPLLSSSQFVLYLLSEFNREQENATPSPPQKNRVSGKRG